MPETPGTPARHAERIVELASELQQKHPVILIDGPAGVGKTTTADALVRSWPGQRPELVRMDDIFPGWNGLARAGRDVGRYLLEPLRDGLPGHWQRHDWAAHVGAEWHEVRRGQTLIIEGCGVLTRQNAPLADLRVWIDGDPELRKRRALERDKGGFDAYWELWAEQMERFIAEHDPVAAADLVLTSD